MKNQSLREKTDKKAGGQPGHQGAALECSGVIDEIVDHLPNYCNYCGQDLNDVCETFNRNPPAHRYCGYKTRLHRTSHLPKNL